MSRRSSVIVGILTVVLAGAAAAWSGPRQTAKPAQPAGWTLPPNAAETKNPDKVDDKLLATGRAVYKDKCQRCHGSAGLGDGPDADSEHQEDMDLTNPKRADRNVDGVVYYKVLNGRRKPKMPAFKDELTPDQIWSVVAYVQTLRKK